MISIIAAIGKFYAIGRNNQLLCHLPNDLKRFKALTTGHAVIMGRKTFESLPNKKPLPNRRNIVLTSKPEQLPEGVIGAKSLNEAILRANTDDIFIIGGASVYKAALPIADRMFLTLIDGVFLGVDTFFPPIEFEQWKEMAIEKHSKDDKHPHDYVFVDYVRKA